MAIQFYKDQKGDLREVGTNRYISASEFGIGTPNAGRGFIEKKNYQAPPDIKRTEDGNVELLQKSPLNDWKNYEVLKNSVRDIIKMKQNFNQDIQGARQKWRLLATDTSPFGGQRDPAFQVAGTFDDAAFREMSPEDQASVRASRYSASESNLRGLEEESKYRQTRTEDMLKQVDDARKNVLEETTAQQDAEYRRLQILKDKKALGMPITQQDLTGDTTGNIIGNREGGSVSWRNNNPGNIKFGPFAEQYGATKGAAASDGGNWAVFPDEQTGIQAQKDLLTSPNYKDLSLDKALLRWSNNGYDSKSLIETIGYTPTWQGKKTSQMSDAELNDLVEAMRKREGWKEGKITNPSSAITHDTWTDGQIQKLAKDLGVSSADLKAQKTDTELDELNQQIRTATIDNALSRINDGIDGNPPMKTAISVRGKTVEKPDPNLIYSELFLLYGDSLNAQEFEAIMNQSGFVKENGVWTNP